MTWFLGLAILAIYAGLEWYAYFFARVNDPDRGFIDRPYWEAATLSWLHPSRDRRVEGHRRASVVLFALAAAWLLVGPIAGGWVDSLASELTPAWLGGGIIAAALAGLVVGARLVVGRFAQPVEDQGLT